MRPRRQIFALDYIRPTLKCYEKLLRFSSSRPDFDKNEILWAHDVLCAYFATVTSHPLIDPLRAHFQSLPSPVDEFRDQSGGFVPYHRDVESAPAVSIEEMFSLARRRRSVRWFLQEPVPRHIIDKSMEVARESPSACNRQPFVFRIFDDPTLVRRLASIPMGTVGYEHNIPVLAVIVGRHRNYSSSRDRHLIYVDAGLAAMSFILALESQGVSTCCINWPDIETRETEMEAFLQLEADERPVMCLAIGYPDPTGLVAYSAKKRLDKIRRFNFE